MIDNEPYYYRKHHWWAYDYDDNDWYIDNDFNYTTSLYYDDYLTSYYSLDYDFENIKEDSQYYNYYSESDDDSSSDSYDSDDYDYDSWDSDTTDWDSDW